MFSRLEYNGVILDEVEVLGYERKKVYNGPTYLWTAHTVHLRGTYNPALNAYTPGPRPAAVPAQVQATTTDQALEYWLGQPRQRLVLTLGPDLNDPDHRLLVSPVQGFDVDANDGPQPVSCNVTEVVGSRTFLVEWVCTTYLTDTEEEGNPSDLLSHRWEEAVDIDQDFFTTRTIKGQAIFASDSIHDRGSVPDDYREWLFHPIPPNFKRVQVHVTVGPNPNTIQYVVVDKEQTQTVIDPLITRIEAAEILHSSHLSSDQFLLQGVESVIGTWQVVLSTLPAIGIGGPDAASVARVGADPHGTSLLGQASSGISSLSQANGVLGRFRNLLPMTTQTYTIKVWGDNKDKAHLHHLLKTALVVLRSRRGGPVAFPVDPVPIVRVGNDAPDVVSGAFSASFLGNLNPVAAALESLPPAFGFNVTIAADLMKPYLELTATYDLNVRAAATAMARVYLDDTRKLMPDSKSIPEVTSRLGRQTKGPDRSRGTYRASLMAQALEDPFTKVRPTLSPPAANLNP